MATFCNFEEDKMLLVFEEFFIPKLTGTKKPYILFTPLDNERLRITLFREGTRHSSWVLDCNAPNPVPQRVTPAAKKQRPPKKGNKS